MTDDIDRLDNMMAVGGRLDVRGSGPAAWGRYNSLLKVETSTAARSPIPSR
jgi:hypothetical protein